MKFKEYLNGITNKSQINENEMRYQALEIAKNIHTELAQLSFIEMLAVMNPQNPAKKEVQALEGKINDLTNEIGDFIQKYIPDVSNAEANDTDELPPEENEEEVSPKPASKPKPKEKPKSNKTQDKNKGENKDEK